MPRSQPGVRVLGSGDLPEVLALLARDPVPNVFVDYRVRLTRLEPRWLGGEVWGWYDGDRLDVTEQVAVPGGVASRAEQHPRPEGCHEPGQLGRAARPEDDLAGKGEVEGRHQPSSAGATALNRVADRGCAIMEATASRQRA